MAMAFSSVSTSWLGYVHGIIICVHFLVGLCYVAKVDPLNQALNKVVLLALAGGATASASSTSAPCTHSGRCTDQRGGVWELGALGGGQAVAGPPDPTYRYTYAFSLYQNLDSIPQICQSFSIFGTNAARYDDSTSAQQPASQQSAAAAR